MRSINPFYFPFRWVTDGMTRKELATHLHDLKSQGKRREARQVIRHALWVGVYPAKDREDFKRWLLS
ncbi:MAG: hypothetical protein ACR2NF_04005 [Pirellulales bacterium]